jgi:hypothetical protein
MYSLREQWISNTTSPRSSNLQTTHMNHKPTKQTIVRSFGSDSLHESPHHAEILQEVTGNGQNANLDHEYDECMMAINELSSNQKHASQEDISSDEDSGINDFNELEDKQRCNRWLNMYGTFTPPIPKHLLIKNQGATRFSGENVLRRTAWIGMLLDIRDKSQLPEMRRIEYTNVNQEKEQVIAIKTENPEQAKTLLKVTRIGTHKVKVCKDIRKNTIRGVLFDAENYFQKENMTQEEIEQLLVGEGVISVKKIGKEKSRSYKVVLDMLEIPDRVKILGANRSFPISPYIPNPLRCFKCQKYDHSNSTCRAETYTCQRCGGDHTNKRFKVSSNNEKILTWECSEKPHCIHCKQSHEAGDADCIRQKQQQEINKTMVKQKLSRYEARTRVLGDQAISNSRAIITAQKLVQKETEATQSKEVIDDIHQMLKQITTQQIKTVPEKTSERPPDSINTESINEMIRKAVEQSTKRMQQDYDQKFEQLQVQLTQQSENMKKLANENAKLKEEAKLLKSEANTLRDQLKTAKAELKKKSQQQSKDDRKRGSNSPENVNIRTKSVTSENRTPITPPKVKPYFEGLTVLSKQSKK